MGNKEIARFLRRMAALMELHDENAFKIKSISNAAFQIDKFPDLVSLLSSPDLRKIPGIGDGIASKVETFVQTGTSPELDELIRKTPVGLLSLLNLKGIGGKKLGLLWRTLGIETSGELKYACLENRLISVPGFGLKTQDAILKLLDFSEGNEGKFRFADIQAIVQTLQIRLQEILPESTIEVTGEYARNCEIISRLSFITEAPFATCENAFSLNSWCKLLSISNKTFTLLIDERFEIDCISANENYEFVKFISIGPPEHINELGMDVSVPVDLSQIHTVYANHGLPFILPELRDQSLNQLAHVQIDRLVEYHDIKGTIHNHSTWSDGADSLENMALAAKKRGWEYLGICDHSRAAFYAQGLSIERVIEQHREIEALNTRLAPFHIFKGIESDILIDGSLDYPNEILSQFDFIVASIHSVLRMDEEKANTRLLKAIENPYTTILGHPTGRLLLSRQGYPINHKKIIDACAANKVVIELNANPMRLDIDWRWISYCMEKGVLISINPDAHHVGGYDDTHFGLMAARKGGLTKDFLFNGKNFEELNTYFSERK